MSEILESLRLGESRSEERLTIAGVGELPSYFDVTGLAAASFGAAGLELARVSSPDAESPRNVQVDRRLASHWFGWSIRPQGWELPSIWDDLAGDYRTMAGWIRLHTNVPAHRAAALRVLSGVRDRNSAKAEILNRSGEELETEIVGEGGCAAEMRSLVQWQEHTHGVAVAQAPLVTWSSPKSCPVDRVEIDSRRPLANVKVLDLTRILAGPVASRFLAACGADVLRIDPPGWDEPGVIPEVTLGKRCTGLDLKDAGDRSVFEGLLKSADVLIHGYRAGAMEGLGYDEDTLSTMNPELINVSLNAYGWAGEWKTRRGFDSLVQMSTGIADFGMQQSGLDRPRPLPVQALDHATGYLLAAAVLSSWGRRKRGEMRSAKLSLARTAHLLCATVDTEYGGDFGTSRDDEIDPRVEATDWGPARRVRWPLQVDGVEFNWKFPASRLRSARPVWSGATG